MPTRKKILLIAVGNPLRGDDGAGHYVCEQIRTVGFEAVHCITVQQLTTDLLDDILQADETVIVDASATAETVQFYPLETGDAGSASSHHTSVHVLARLSRQLYNREPVFFICAIGTTSFDHSDQLSAFAKQNADLAAGILIDWIREHEN